MLFRSTLAQRSSSAAKEIRQLIVDSADKVDQGSRLVEAARSTMEEALAAVQRVGHTVDQISHGAGEQLSGIQQINEAVSQMDGITQQNAALVEEIAAAASQLEGKARNVTEAVGVFQLSSGDLGQSRDAVALRRAAKGQQAEALAG